MTGVENMTNGKLRVKALLLDLDGTLVDSTEALREAGRAGFWPWAWSSIVMRE